MGFCYAASTRADRLGALPMLRCTVSLRDKAPPPYPAKAYIALRDRHVLERYIGREARERDRWTGEHRHANK